MTTTLRCVDDLASLYPLVLLNDLASLDCGCTRYKECREHFQKDKINKQVCDCGNEDGQCSNECDFKPTDEKLDMRPKRIPVFGQKTRGGPLFKTLKNQSQSQFSVKRDFS